MLHCDRYDGTQPYLSRLDSDSPPVGRDSDPALRDTTPTRSTSRAVLQPADNQIHNKTCDRRERHRSLNIQNLIGVPLLKLSSIIAQSKPGESSVQSRTMTTSESASPNTMEGFVPFSRFTDLPTNPASSIDSETLASLAGDVPKPVSVPFEKRFDTLGPYMTNDEIKSISNYGRAESRASSALSVLTPYSDSPVDDPIGRQGAPQMTSFTTDIRTLTAGRPRSDTARRYDSLASIESAPAGFDERPYTTSSLLRSPSAASCVSFAGHTSDHGTGLFGGGSATHSVHALSFNDDSMSEPHLSSGGARKKRNKCSPEQLRQLEKFFSTNRNPTGKVREELSRRIQMPERSVQIWFQNKRAKAKIIEAREGSAGDQIAAQSGSALARSQSSFQPRLSSESESSGARKFKKAVVQPTDDEEPVLQLPVSSLCIGQWRRISPLICIFSRRNQSFSWFLSSESVGFKLECPRTSVKRVTFTGPRDPTMHEFAEGVHTPVGLLAVELDRPPQFYMEVFRSSGGASDGGGDEQQQPAQKASWRQCVDFTENKQATADLIHFVSGPYETLRQAVMQLKESKGTIAHLVEMQDADTQNGVGHAFYGQTTHDVGGSAGSSMAHTTQLSLDMPTSSAGQAFQYERVNVTGWSGNAASTGGAGDSSQSLSSPVDGGSSQLSSTSMHALQQQNTPGHDHTAAQDAQHRSPGLDVDRLRINTMNDNVSRSLAATVSPMTANFSSDVDSFYPGSANYTPALQWPHSAAAPVSQTAGWLYTSSNADVLPSSAAAAATYAQRPSTSVVTSITAASAPAFAFSTFEAQQQQQQQHHQRQRSSMYEQRQMQSTADVSQGTYGALGSASATQLSPYDPRWSAAAADAELENRPASFSDAYPSVPQSRSPSFASVGVHPPTESHPPHSISLVAPSAMATSMEHVDSYQSTSFRNAPPFRFDEMTVDEHSADTLMPHQPPL